jgi:hypothetical protein
MRKLPVLLALLLPLAGLPACEPLTGSPDEVEIRVYNNSDHTFRGVVVNGVALGDVPPAEYSRYAGFEEAYPYGAVSATVDGKPLGIMPIDYVGETPLPPGRYTYLVSADPESGAMVLHFFEGDRLPGGSRPAGAKRVLAVEVRDEGLGAARGANGEVMVAGERTTLTHVNPTVSERPGSRVIYIPEAVVVTGTRRGLAARVAPDGGVLQLRELAEPGISARAPAAAAPARDGGFLLAGSFERPVTLPDGGRGWDMDAWLVRTDGAGAEVWSRFLGATSFDFAGAVIPTADGGFAMAGQSNRDAWLVKLDAAGGTQWTRGFLRDGRAESVAQTPDGGFLLAGDRFGTIKGGDGGWVTRTDPSGNERWTTRFPGSAEAVLATPAGGAVVAGTTTARGGQLLRIDPAGKVEWQRSPGLPAVHALADAPGGGWFAAGAGFSLVRADADGGTLWTRSYSSTAPAEARAVLPHSDGGATVVGTAASRILVVRADAYGQVVWRRLVGS